MPDDLESIGGLSVTISGDYSQLMTDLQQSQSIAADGGSQIAASLSTAAGSADTFEAAVQRGVESGMTLAEAMHAASAAVEQAGTQTGDASERFFEFSDAAQSVIAKQTELESAAAHAQATVNELRRGYDEGTVSAEALARAESQLATATHQASAAGAEHTGVLDSIGERAIDLATELGLVVAAGELLKSAFEDFATVQSAAVAMTALTGSAETANEQIEQAEQLAQDENLPFPALLEATQRMDAFGFSLESIPGALRAAADAAAAVNSSVDQTANVLERMAAAGMAGARQIVQLGLNTKDLAAVMGVAESDITKTFKALDQETRLEVLGMALHKFSGVSEAAAGTLKGEWQGVKNSFEALFKSVGEFLEPLAQNVLAVFKQMADAIKFWVEVAETAAQAIHLLWTRITQGAEAAAKELAGLANAEKEAAKGPAAGPPLHVFTEASFAKEFNQDLQTQKWQEATNLIRELAETNLPAAQAAMKKLVEAEGEASGAAGAHTEHLDRLRAITHDYGGELQFQIEMYQKAVAAQKAYEDEVAAFGVEIGANELGLSRAEVVQLKLNDAQLDTVAGLKAISASIPPVIDDMGHLSETGERTSASWKELTKSSDDFTKSLNSMLGETKPPIDALHEALAKIDKDFAAGNLAPIEALINRLAVEDLPGAVAQQDRLVSALENTGAAQEKINAAIKEQITLHEQLAASQGKSLTGYQVGLALADLQTKNFGYDIHNVLGTMATQAIDLVDTSLSKLGPQFSKLIVEGGSFGKMMHQIFTQFAEDLLSTVINAIIKTGEEFVIEKLLERGTGSATNVGQILSEAPVAAANAFAATAAIPIIGPLLAPAAAAEAMGFVTALAPLAAFEVGGYVPETMLALVHKGEYVMPAKDIAASATGPSFAPGGLSIQIGALHGVTRDTADHLATLIFRKARLAGAFH